jgi:DNA repair exonuclease SbcCD nuclease subunit
MKFQAMGDPHFRTEALDLVDRFTTQALVSFDTHKPDFVVCLGDTLHCHEKLHSAPLNKAVSFFLAIAEKFPLFVLVGNHDMQDNQQFLSDKHWLNCMKHHKNITVVDIVVYDEKFNCTFVPYVPNGRFQDALYTLQGDGSSKHWRNSDVIFAHQEFFGAKMGAIVSTSGDEWGMDLPTVITGHIHDRQTPQPNIIYPGCSMPTAFGDSQKKGIFIADTKSPQDHSYHFLDMPIKKTVKVNLGTTELDDVPDLENTDSAEIRAVVEGDKAEIELFKESKKYNEMIKKGVKVVLRPNVQEVSVDEKQDLETPFVSQLMDYVSSTEPQLKTACCEVLENSSLAGRESLIDKLRGVKYS